MHETSKSEYIRNVRGDFDKWLKGSGIDIGAGADPLKVKSGTVRGWDMQDGDAQLMAGVSDDTYDFVYSSHCLEHMRDVTESLKNWLRILRSGGFLYVVVPEYVLYEKMCWPSRYNSDHKQSFSVIIKRETVMRPNHYSVQLDMFPLLESLGAEPVFAQMEDYLFNYNCGIVDQTHDKALAQICIVAKKK